MGRWVVVIAVSVAFIGLSGCAGGGETKASTLGASWDSERQEYTNVLCVQLEDGSEATATCGTQLLEECGFNQPTGTVEIVFRAWNGEGVFMIEDDSPDQVMLTQEPSGAWKVARRAP